MAQKKQDDFSGLISYLSKIESRISQVEEQSRISLNEAGQQQNYLEGAKSRIDFELKQIKSNVNLVKQTLEMQRNILKGMVSEFKGIAKKDNLDRLKYKVEAWGPERFITHSELKKKL